MMTCLDSLSAAGVGESEAACNTTVFVISEKPFTDIEVLGFKTTNADELCTCSNRTVINKMPILILWVATVSFCLVVEMFSDDVIR